MAKVRLPPKPPPPSRLEVLPAAARDLEAMGQPALKGKFWAFIEELRDDQRKLTALAGREETQTGDFFNVVVVGEFARHLPKRRILRIKSYQMLDVRFIYAYFEQSHIYIVLAVAPRSWNYVYNDVLGRRIAVDYDRLLGKYG